MSFEVLPPQQIEPQKRECLSVEQSGFEDGWERVWTYKGVKQKFPLQLPERLWPGIGVITQRKIHFTTRQCDL